MNIELLRIIWALYLLHISSFYFFLLKTICGSENWDEISGFETCGCNKSMYNNIANIFVGLGCDWVFNKLMHKSLICHGLLLNNPNPNNHTLHWNNGSQIYTKNVKCSSSAHGDQSIRLETKWCMFFFIG